MDFIYKKKGEHGVTQQMIRVFFSLLGNIEMQFFLSPCHFPLLLLFLYHYFQDIFICLKFRKEVLNKKKYISKIILGQN